MTQSTAITLAFFVATLLGCYIKAHNSDIQCDIIPSWKQLSGTFTVRGRVMSNGQPKSGVYVTLQGKQ
uniref:Uncharacterized protein n=1 Tax=Romanomermis culicivorax TaxID=13658 RepID=A0A915KXE2_ROMCU